MLQMLQISHFHYTLSNWSAGAKHWTHDLGPRAMGLTTDGPSHHMSVCQMLCVVMCWRVAVIGIGGASAWSIICQEMDDDAALIQAATAAGHMTTDDRQRSEHSTTAAVDSDTDEETVIVLGDTTRNEPNQQIDLTRALKRKHWMFNTINRFLHTVAAFLKCFYNGANFDDCLKQSIQWTCSVQLYKTTNELWMQCFWFQFEKKS